MKRNTEDFFEQMKNFKTNTTIFEVICLIVAILSLLVAYVISFLYNKIPLSNVALIICGVIFFLMLIFLLVDVFTKNGIRFLEGNFWAGLKSFSIVALPLYIILIILFITLPTWREFLRSAFTIVTTIGVAILTIMGVHYSISKQQQSKNEEHNLIFTICEDNKGLNQFSIINSTGNKTIQINLKNVSGNFGYLIGIYRICGCDAYQIGDNLPYLPIEPNSGYSITNIKTNLGDDQLLIVYKDISQNHYYLLVSSNYKYIEFSDKCNMDFLRWRMYATTKSENRIKKKNLKKSLQSTPDHTLTIENVQNSDESFIIERKELTKPKLTRRENGFDLIESVNGDILTDKLLLNELRKARTKLSKEKKVKPYMIFNNQQLVAMATYKPYTELEFISIYGLGKKKYDLYGEIFIPIINMHK